MGSKYIIKYANGLFGNAAESEIDLIKWLKALRDETITDILKLNNNGVSVSVLDEYRNCIL